MSSIARGWRTVVIAKCLECNREVGLTGLTLAQVKNQLRTQGWRYNADCDAWGCSEACRVGLERKATRAGFGPAA